LLLEADYKQQLAGHEQQKAFMSKKLLETTDAYDQKEAENTELQSQI